MSGVWLGTNKCTNLLVCGSLIGGHMVGPGKVSKNSARYGGMIKVITTLT